MPKNAEKPSVEHVIPDHLQILSQQFMRFGQHLRTTPRALLAPSVSLLGLHFGTEEHLQRGPIA